MVRSGRARRGGRGPCLGGPETRTAPRVRQGPFADTLLGQEEDALFGGHGADEPASFSERHLHESNGGNVLHERLPCEGDELDEGERRFR